MTMNTKVGFRRNLVCVYLILNKMAPELAGDMLFFAQQDDLEESPEYLKSRSCQESKSFTKSISLVKLQRILRIRQLLLKSRIQAIKSSSLKSPWTMPFLDHAVSPCPPIICFFLLISQPPLPPL